jgi:nucleoside-diphosphate-sugar epimerase
MTTRHPLATDLEEILAVTRGLWDELRAGRIFITGATGFFGCWLLESFTWANKHLDLKARATILTRNPNNLPDRLPHLDTSSIDVVRGNIRDFRFPSGGFSHIIHAASEAATGPNANQIMFDSIVEGTRHCLEFAKHTGAHKFLFTSSGAVYGKQPPELSHIPEGFTGGPDPLEQTSGYGEGKRAAELLCALAAQRTGLEAKIARCFTFVGPYLKLDSFAVGNFIRDYVECECILVHGDGTSFRSYLYASDLMIWLWTILFRGESGRAYNVGSEDAISIVDLAHEVGSCGVRDSGQLDEIAVNSRRSRPLRTPVKILGTGVPGALSARYVPSTARAQKELGLRCSVPLRESIKRTVEWNKTHALAL